MIWKDQNVRPCISSQVYALLFAQDLHPSEVNNQSVTVVVGQAINSSMKNPFMPQQFLLSLMNDSMEVWENKHGNQASGGHILCFVVCFSPYICQSWGWGHKRYPLPHLSTCHDLEPCCEGRSL